MTRLPVSIDFDEMDHPELIDIFRGIDAGVAAIVASDPAFRPKPVHKRRRAHSITAGVTTRRTGRIQRKAA